MMITITICNRSLGIQHDFIVNSKQIIEDALRIIEEKHLIEVSTSNYVRLKVTNRLCNKKLTFREANIYNGEMIILDE